MYIELKELFINRNYKGYVDKVYFDRKKYTIVDSSFYNEHKNDDKYERYIPLFEVDEE